MDITVPLDAIDRASVGGRADLVEIIVLALDAGASEERVAAGCVEPFGTSRSDWLLAVFEHATALLHLGRGDYAAVLASAPRSASRPLPSVAYPNIVEAATRCGQPFAAIEATEALAARLGPSPSGPGAGLLARCRALVDETPDAELAYRDAIARLEICCCTLEVARSRLVYGEWLRRSKRRGDAREQLRAAEQIFTAMGARTLAGRAQVELAATGESARRREVDTINDLTPQEAHVARLAAAGWTNAEIAAALFLSTSTVDYHLRKVFRKLAVTSRRKLRLVLALGEEAAVVPPAALCTA